MKIVVNPYKAGPPVKGDDFYGRADLLTQLYHDLGRSNVILLQGQRRIGKTSLLHQLRRFLTSKEAGNKGFLPLSFDIQRYVDDTLPEFQEHLARTIAKELPLDVPGVTELESDPALFCETWLPKVFECLGSRRIVLLVDEFDNLGERKDSRAVEALVPFIGDLVARELQMKWVFAVGRHIGKLPIQYDRIVARAVKLPVGRLTPEETRQLILEPASGMLTFQSDAVERIYQLTSGQPHLTQALCWEVFERAVLDEERDVATREDVDAVLIRTLDTYEGPIASIARVPAVEERVLVVVARLTEGKTASRDDIIQLLLEHRISLEREEVTDALNRLVEWDLLVCEDQRWRPTIELMRIWMAKNMSLEPSREQELDLFKARAQNSYELAERGRREGNYEFAIQYYGEALKHVPMHQEALRGLAEAYRITDDLAGRAETLQKLYRLDYTVLPGLVEALAEYAQKCEREGKAMTAAQQYEVLIKLQDSSRWQQGLVRVCLQEVNKFMEEVKKPVENRSSLLAEARRDIEYGLTIVSQSSEVEKLKKKLKEIEQKEKELKHEEWISSKRAEAQAAEAKENWEAAAHALLDLQEAQVELTRKEERTLQMAAWQRFYNQSSPSYRWTPWLTRGPPWFKSMVGALAGLVEALLLVKLVPTTWSAPLYALLIAVNIGLIKALARQHARRVLTVHLMAGGAAAGLLLLTRSLVEFQFPPASLLAYIVLIVMVATPLASVVSLEMSFDYGIRTGIDNGIYTLVGGTICALFVGVLVTVLDNTLLLPMAAGLGLGIGWILVSLIMELGDPAIYGVNPEEVHLIFRR